MATKTRAAKGGEWVQGVFYKGGQFLPTENPQFGKFNHKNNTAKVRKVQIAPYVWVPQEAGKNSIFTRLAGTVARMNGNEMVFCGNAQTLAYTGMTEKAVKDLIAQYNSGERWF